MKHTPRPPAPPPEVTAGAPYRASGCEARWSGLGAARPAPLPGAAISRRAGAPSSALGRRRPTRPARCSASLVWGLGMEAARHPRRAVRAAALAFLGFTAAFGIGLQAVVRSFTHAYLGRRALLLALGIPSLAQLELRHARRAAHRRGLPRARGAGGRRSRCCARAGSACAAAGPSVAAGAAARRRPRHLVRALRRAQGFQCLPPDVLWINGTGGPLLYALGLAAASPRPSPSAPTRRSPPRRPLPRPTRPPSCSSSARACGATRSASPGPPGCTLSPRVDEAAPARIGYARAFSTASCTELASTALWTGLPVDRRPRAAWRARRSSGTGPRRAATAPAYFTSQNLLFQQSDQFLRGSRIDRLREARDRVVDAPIDDGSPDEDTTGEALAFLEAAGAPAFVVVHHANTHAPYRQTPGFTPHPERRPPRPLPQQPRPERRVVGDLVTRLRRSAAGPARDRALHVRSRRGVGRARGRTSTRSISTPSRSTSRSGSTRRPAPCPRPRSIASAARRPRARSRSPTSRATLVDLVGGLDAPALRARAAALAGTSLLRDAARRAATCCSGTARPRASAPPRRSASSRSRSSSTTSATSSATPATISRPIPASSRRSPSPAAPPCFPPLDAHLRPPAPEGLR